MAMSWKPALLRHGVDALAVGQGEHPRRVRRPGDGSRNPAEECRHEYCEPLLFADVPRAGECQAPAGSQRVRDGGEGRHGVGEESQPASADGDVELVRRERVHLHVALLEPDVGQPFGGHPGARRLQHRTGQVDPERIPVPGATRSLPGDLAVAAAEVEHPVGRADAGRREERFVELRADRVPLGGMVCPVPALRPVPRLGLFNVDDRRHVPPPRSLPARAAVGPV
ncbi:hypothetical protein [Micromonospora sp. WMMD980]|uniref:hypothetical protein n=1 Tax=Micromonospora sp. WMMD980 TaxID=3016088 RepID=UPI0024172E67|nr:hypothetical protein [Micromonospora sp. WMMD980]MDG4800172.1 hypothetical protein [Micromonospora sp. WMMD980]